MRYDAVAFLESLFQPLASDAADSGRPASAAPASRPSLTPNLPPEWHLAWDERAAIMEYDGGLPREQAEALALAEIQRQMRAALPITSCPRRACMNNNDACNESK